MKVHDEYFLMAVFTLLLNRLHVFCKFYVSFEKRNMAFKGSMFTYTRTKQQVILKIV